MSKRDTFYFPHEYNAKDDPKCERLIWEMGMEGYGMFWTLLEVLRAQPDYTYPVANIPIIARKRTKFQMKFAMRVVSPQKEIIETKAMDPEYCFSLVETLVDELRKRKANIAENRSNRYAIGCSLASELKERGQAFFHTVSSLSAKYDARECDRQYDRCLIHCDRYTLDTFFRYCKEAWLRW